MSAQPQPTQPLVVHGPMRPGYAEILSPEALDFVGALVERFGARVPELLARRKGRQARFDAGELPHFLPETRAIREADWTVAPLPADLRDRRVEITGPVDRKMIINALNSGANVFMADLEDSNSPTWANVVEGQIHLRDAVRGTIAYEHPEKGTYRLNPTTAVLMVRPRGWHLVEGHVHYDGEPIPAGLFDFGLYLFHNAHALLAKGSGPYFYLPKMESHHEARLWNDVFVFAQDALGIPQGTIKATVLIETLPAAFELDEILHALQQHSAGLNCGRWDYIFSVIKTLRAHPDKVLPDRAQVGMTAPFMAAYTHRVIQVCHRREVFAMGGMAAQIPIKGDLARNEAALAKVRADKLREVTDGHDGTWVAHPGLVGIAREVFDAHMPTPNQIHVKHPEWTITEADLLDLPKGSVTEEGVRHNVRVGVQYLAAWLDANGCVPLYDLMEDAATAEISRTQIWQWLKHGVVLDDGRPLDRPLFDALLADEVAKLRAAVPAWEGSTFPRAVALFTELSTADALADFLTLAAYGDLLTITEE